MSSKGGVWHQSFAVASEETSPRSSFLLYLVSLKTKKKLAFLASRTAISQKAKIQLGIIALAFSFEWSFFLFLCQANRKSTCTSLTYTTI